MRLFFFLLLLSGGAIFADVPYSVHFEGVRRKEVLESLKEASQLETLKDHPPSTLNALKRRAEGDLPNLVAVFQTWAHYHPHITYSIDEKLSPARVTFHIHPGPQYMLSGFSIEPANPDEACPPFPIDEAKLQKLGVHVGTPALPDDIHEIEGATLTLFAKRGYPHAIITKREVFADEETATIFVHLIVDPGPIISFGDTIIKGLRRVHPLFVERQLNWYPGDQFHPGLIEETQGVLEQSSLFTCATITPADALDEEGRLPMIIEVEESKHRTIGAGIGYNTQLGPGGTVDWESRNLTGMGDKLTTRLDWWEIKQRGEISYKQHDVGCIGQDMIWIVELEKEKTQAYKETFLSLSEIFERPLSKQARFSYGIQFKELQSTDSNNNGTFSLLKAPLQYKWSSANNLLNPTRGESVNVKLTPTVQLLKPVFTYYIALFNGMVYHSFDEEGWFVLAAKASFGSIFGASDQTIPPPERLYAGNENLLRGYAYETVSPLDENNKPVGGRSLMVYSFEIRSRFTECWGAALFYEVGNVYSQILPQFTHPQLRSWGFGLRYHTPVGPLRIDIAFPLDKRPGIDKKSFQLYFNIGQTF